MTATLGQTTHMQPTQRHRRVLRRGAGALAAAVLVGVMGGGISTADAQEPQGDDAISCPDAPAQLQGRDLTAPDAVELVSQADLRCADLAGADLHGLDLTQADLQGANLRGADLHGARLGQARMRRADLREADLSGARLSQADLRDANLGGATLTEADLIQAQLERARLPRIDAAMATFSQATMQRVDLTDAVLRRAGLGQADLSDAVLTRADLTGATAFSTEFVRADLSGARMVDGSFSTADFTNADLSGADVSGATFFGAVFELADTDGVVGASSPVRTAALLSGLAGLVLIGTAVVSWRRRQAERPDGGQLGGIAVVVAAVVQAVGLYLLACGATAQYAQVASPLHGATDAPVIGALATSFGTAMVGSLLLILGTMGRVVTRRRPLVQVM